jgi:hypothetical protein
MSISKEAIEAAARAWAIHDETDGCFERVDEWEALEDWEREAHPDEYPGSDYEDCGDYRERAIAALTSVAPHIQAAALRDAAEVLEGGWAYGAELKPDGNEDRAIAAAIQMTHENAEQLRARADRLEAEMK